MINPGGKPGVTFDRSATTRFNNNQVEAQKSSMPHNKAAQSALRKKYTGAKAQKPGAVGKSKEIELPDTSVGPVKGQASIPTGGPQMPPQEEEFDPSVFVDQKVNDIIGEMKLTEFAQSPQTKDLMTNIKLKNFFNQRNPNYHADTRSLIEQLGSKGGVL